MAVVRLDEVIRDFELDHTASASPFQHTSTHVASERNPLVFLGEDLHYDPAVQPTDDDLQGAIGLILWVNEGRLSGIEIWGAGNFKDPETFPPAELFEAPSVAREE